eukprot:7794927-Pyramimonas_sp.AAC.1
MFGCRGLQRRSGPMLGRRRTGHYRSESDSTAHCARGGADAFLCPPRLSVGQCIRSRGSKWIVDVLELEFRKQLDYILLDSRMASDMVSAGCANGWTPALTTDRS